MIEVDYESIYTILDKETADKVCRYFKGCRVSFNRHSIEHKEMYESYKEMIKSGHKNSDAIGRIADLYGVSKRSAYWVIKKMKNK